MKTRVVTIVFAAFFIVAGLSSHAMANKKKIRIGYVEWSCATAASNTVQAVLQEKMGYEVELLPVSAAAMWKALEIGDIDATVCAWMPVTHGQYVEKIQDKVVNLGPNLEGAGIGLVVPQYVTIDSIAEINENANKFKRKIIGIDPGAGIMSATEKAIEEYNLDKIQLIDSSGAMMTATLANKIKKKEWVIVTGWTPHWKFSRWNLKYLEDPKKVYGGTEQIITFVRKGLKEDMPEVYSFLDNFYWTLPEIGEQMGWNADGTKPYDSAKKWVDENPERVNEWLQEP